MQYQNLSVKTESRITMASHLFTMGYDSIHMIECQFHAVFFCILYQLLNKIPFWRILQNQLNTTLIHAKHIVRKYFSETGLTSHVFKDVKCYLYMVSSE